MHPPRFFFCRKSRAKTAHNFFPVQLCQCSQTEDNPAGKASSVLLCSVCLHSPVGAQDLKAQAVDWWKYRICLDLNTVVCCHSGFALPAGQLPEFATLT